LTRRSKQKKNHLDFGFLLPGAKASKSRETGGDIQKKEATTPRRRRPPTGHGVSRKQRDASNGGRLREFEGGVLG